MYFFHIYMISVAIVFLFALYQSIYILLNEKTSILLKFVAILVLVSTIYLGVRRNTYLPFLGPTVLPQSLLKDVTDTKMGEVHVRVELDVPDETRVLYWAASPSTSVIENPYDAYNQYTNVGVSSVKNKQAMLHIDCPASYKVPMKTLRPHVHYRVVYPNGLLGSVKTVYVNCS